MGIVIYKLLEKYIRILVLDDDLVLPISAVVVTALKEDILLGTPFMKKNKMIIDFGSDSIRVRNREIFFKDIITKPRTSLLKANVSRAIFPGESVDFGIPANFGKDNEVTIEPRDNLAWPTPQIVSTNDEKMEVRNDTKFPMKIKSQEVVAQIRSVMTPEKGPLDYKEVTTKTWSESDKKSRCTSRSTRSKRYYVKRTKRCFCSSKHYVFKYIFDSNWLL